MRLPLLTCCIALLGACSCQRQPAVDAAGATPASIGAASVAGPTARTSDVTHADARLQAQRARALYDATDVLHAYLRELGSGKRAEADQRWAYQRSPTGSEEAGLRALDNLQALRIDNTAPKALDNEPVPAYVEIPVQLRATLDDGLVARYRGWYRLRHDPVSTRWELTAASITPVLR